jgi:methylmalonyl-CoA mutase N-terminal domain/subunit
MPQEVLISIRQDLFAYSASHVPRWNTISVSGYHIREAGSTAVQELAFTLANGKAYLKAAIDKGLDINVFGKRVSFFFNCHNNFFEEIAKFRAARRIWATITRDLGATDADAQKLRFHTQTGGSTLTAQQPRNNIIRVTNQAMAAVLGGTQSLHTNGYDEALSLPGEEAATIALRTQQIIAFETGVTDTVDPLAGSYFIEALTDELEAAAMEYIKKIDSMGGAVSAIESGYIQQEIASAAYEFQKNVEKGERIIVGVNKYHDGDVQQDEVLSIGDSIRTSRIQALNRLKKERDNDLVGKELTLLRKESQDGGNTMPSILRCVEAYATLGEISDVMREVFGEY